MKRQDIFYIIACIVLILANLSMKAYNKEVRIPLTQVIESLPKELGEFIGVDDYPSDRTYHDPLADKWILRIYTKKGEDKPIRVFVGYWESQSEKKKITPPRYTTEGWEYYWIKTKPVLLGSNDTVMMKEFLNERGQAEELVYYCYIIKGRIISDEYQLRLLNVVNSLFYRKNNAALLRVSLPVTHEFPLDIAEAHGETFIKGFLPVLLNYLPN